MMTGVYLILAATIMVSFTGGAVRLLRGPSRADRMMGAQLFGTTGAAIVLVLAAALDAWILLDVALVFAGLAAVTVIAFVQRAHQYQETPDATVDGVDAEGRRK